MARARSKAACDRRQDQTPWKEKRGDPYLRRLFVHGGRAVLSRVQRDAHQFGSWLDRLEAQSPQNLVVIAMANNIVHIAWAVLTSGQTYRTSAEVKAIT